MRAETNKFKGKDVYKYLRSRGVPEAGAKAMVANIAVESNYTFDPSVKQTGKRKDPAYGLFQFDPRGSGLAKPYEKYLEDTDKEDGMESQLDFFVDTVFGQYKEGRKHIGYGDVQKFKKAAESGNVEEATKSFSENVLRPGKPHLERRLNAAKNIKQYIGDSEEEVTIEQSLKNEANMGKNASIESDMSQSAPAMSPEEELEEALRQIVPQGQGQISPLAPGAAPNQTKWSF